MFLKIIKIFSFLLDPLASAPSVATEDNLDIGFKTSAQCELLEDKTVFEITDKLAIGPLNTSDDQVLEVLKEDDLAELNQTYDVDKLSPNGRISIYFRPSTKHELFFFLGDENNKESISGEC